MDELQSVLKATERAAAQLLPWLSRLRDGAKATFDELAVKTLGEDFAERLRQLEEQYEQRGEDPFGLNLDYPKYGAMTTAFLHRLYFRTEVTGIANVPKGRALLVANHAGQLPIDGVLMCTSMFLDANPPRLVRAMVERWIPTLPFVSTFFSRVGQVVGVPDNCRRLLERDELILVFPEGVRGISKPYTERYQLQPFGSGFVRLAVQTGAPVVPVAIVGSEEQYISLGNMRQLARTLGLPALPLIPQLLIPGGFLPLPTKYHIHYGEPLRFDGDPNDDESVLSDKAWLVKQTIQGMLDRALSERRGIFR